MLNFARTAQLLALACAPLVIAGCDGPVERPPAETLSKPEFVGAASCAECHAQQLAAWTTSHHAAAMRPADPTTVLGDFDDARFSDAGSTSKFLSESGGYSVRTTDSTGEAQDYPVRYTFGVEPLQQYLVEMPNGRLQAYDVAWDSRAATAGGQRWFRLRSETRVQHVDPRHWSGLLQNWNAVCADCHSTNLVKNYQPQTDTYSTSFTDPNVSCEACHGPGSQHVAQPRRFRLELGTQPRPWRFADASPIAQPDFDTAGRTELDTCARCHSRRSQQTDALLPGDPLLDGFRPALLEPGLYFADGQIRDEVFVYGSFLQSRMHQAGVVCGDCHEPHSLQLRAEGDAVCTRCHQPSVFAVPDHHQHDVPAGNPGCIDCHMPGRIYMTVDLRRDHSFRVPRPDLTVSTGSPNACSSCHEQTATWAAERIAAWYPQGRGTTFHYGKALHAGRRWAVDRLPLLRRVIDDPAQPGIVRATAIGLYMQQPDNAARTILTAALNDADALLRLAAIDALGNLAPQDRARLLPTALRDTNRVLRTAAVRAALPIREQLDGGTQAELDAALNELGALQEFNFDRPEGLLARAELEIQLSRPAAAEQALELAVSRFPAFIAPYSNLADLFRATGRDREAVDLLRKGLQANPDSTDLKHSLGLALVRTGDTEAALELLRDAAAGTDANPRYDYVYGVALNSLRDATSASAALRAAAARYPAYAPNLLALATISRDSGDRTTALRYARQALELAPGNAEASAFVRELERLPLR